MKTEFLFLVALIAAVLAIPAEADIWARGGLHTHTTNSDGDSEPQVVADWYRDNGYQFLVISDHGKVTDVSALNAGQGFLLIHGEEVEVAGAHPPIHANAIGSKTVVPYPPQQVTRAKSLQNLVKVIRDAGAIPMINHPNWHWSLTHREMLQVPGTYLLEIANESDGCNNAGNNAFLSLEQTWDVLLSNGKTVYAAATDDMHGLKEGPSGSSGPGRGWVVARVPELTTPAILSALANGEFYSSTGVALEDYSFDGREFKVKVAPEEGKRYLIRFVGKWGSILQETTGTSASYKFIGKPDKNDYVRCKVIAGDQKVAWTQAYRIGDAK